MSDILKKFDSLESLQTYSCKKNFHPIEDIIFSDIDLKKDVKILDLGCGAGRTTFALLEKGFHNIRAVDIAPNLVAQAKKQNETTEGIFQIGDATCLEFEDAEFDLVFFSYNGIDYIPTKEKRIRAFQEVERVLKKNGLFLFSSHNRLCIPTNRNLLFTQIRNLYRIFSQYWYTKQSFGVVKTYYSNPYKLEKDLIKSGFTKKKTYCENYFLYPFLQTFPYYLYIKNDKKNCER